MRRLAQKKKEKMFQDRISKGLNKERLDCKRNRTRLDEKTTLNSPAVIF